VQNFAPHCLERAALENSIVRLNGVAKFVQLGRGEFTASSLLLGAFIIISTLAPFYDMSVATTRGVCVERCKVRPRCSIISSLLPREPVSAAERCKRFRERQLKLGQLFLARDVISRAANF